MPACGYEFYVLVARTISHSFASLTREILFLSLEHKIHILSPPCNILYLLHRYECFTGKNSTRKIHRRPHPGLEWHIIQILTGEDIDDFTDIKFVS